MRRYVVDLRDGRVGEVVGQEGELLRLRSLAGVTEWRCPADAVRSATAQERLKSKLAEVNHRSESDWP